MITLVTAFFNINRGNWKTFTRSSETYLEAFSKWAHMKNDLIIYLEDEGIKERVLEIRRKYGLLEKTHVYIIKAIEKIDEEIYQQLKEIEKDNIHQIWRLKPHNPEVINSDYNYVMYLKFWCIKHATEYYKLNENIAWIDFGYAHNGSLYPYEEDFSFEWDYEFGNKVTLFSIKEIDKRPAFDIINTMDTFIMGCIFIVPASMAFRLYDDIRSVMKSILTLGYMDDDQIMLLISLREHPDYICALPSKWFLPIKQYGNNEMRIIQKKDRKGTLKSFYRNIRNTWIRMKYLKTLNSHLKTVEYK